MNSVSCNTSSTKGRAIVVHPFFSRDSLQKNVGIVRRQEDILREAEGLVRAIHLDVSSTQSVNVSRINPAQLIGKGAGERLAEIIAREEPCVVVVNAKLSPVQQRNLEKLWNCKVIDRTGLILEIFGERAQTREGKIQVDLAFLEYQKSRLVRSWTHLERQRGGGGFMGGPGETQIELDRRIITDRITQLKKDLEQVRRTRDLARKNREKVPFPVVALVGYTNAGKSTLFNRMTGAHVFAENMPFATLDPTMRRISLKSGREIILSDTVGFISDLPTTLVEAFRATLEQVCYADIILHVRDVSTPDHAAQREDVIAVLGDLGIDYQQDTRIFEVFNKIDCCSATDLNDLNRTASFSQDRIFPVSAITGEGLEPLLKTIEGYLARDHSLWYYDLLSHDGKALAWLYAHAEVLSQHVLSEEGKILRVSVKMSDNIAGRFESRFLYKRQSETVI